MPISPNQGSTGGGTIVTITGTNLRGVTAVRFGSKLATITANTPTSVTVMSPSGKGVVGVTVTTAGGTSNPVCSSTSAHRSRLACLRLRASSPAATRSPSPEPACPPPPR
ncbi:IPT/TIG domain-containing protein [Nocardia gipuzkoensis]